MNCYNCNCEITEENMSAEHILPQGIGGREKSDQLLCRDCNSRFGDSIDAALNKAFEAFVATLAVERQRSKGLPILKNLLGEDGELYNITDGRKPEHAKPIFERDGDKLRIRARSKAELVKMLEGLKARYPNINVEEILNKARTSEHYMPQPININLQLGGDELLRSVAKSALNVYLVKGGDRGQTQSIRDFINGKTKNDDRTHLYWVVDHLTWGEQEASHLIYIKGSAERKILYAYVVLFSAAAYVVNISDQYSGDDFETLYCYDVLKKDFVNRDFTFDYPGRVAFMAQHVTEHAHTEFYKQVWASTSKYVGRIFGMGDRIQTIRGAEEISENVFREVLGKYPMGVPITKEMTNELSSEWAEQIVAYMARANSRNAPRERGA